MDSKILFRIVALLVVFIIITITLTFTYRQRKDKPWAKWVFRLVLGITLVLILGVLLFKRPDPFFNPNSIPQIITANVVDAQDIYQVSKFRSGAGHDYSGNGETCRSMKHYVNYSHSVDPVTHQGIRSQPTANHPNIIIHAPFNGLIVNASHDDGKLGFQVDIMPWQNPFYTVRLDHMDLSPSLHMGSIVNSDQPIGTIGPSDDVDISVWAGEIDLGGDYGQLVSYFQAMTDQTFAPWATLGYQRNDFIISKEYRDAHPLQCEPDSDSFVQVPGQLPNLNDYVFLRPDPYPRNIFEQEKMQIHYGPPTRN